MIGSVVVTSVTERTNYLVYAFRTIKGTDYTLNSISQHASIHLSRWKILPIAVTKIYTYAGGSAQRSEENRL